MKLNYNIFYIVCTFFFLGVNISCTSDDTVSRKEDQEQAPEGVDRDGDGVIRILAIGNSFSQDAVETNLYELARAGGYDAVVANLYIGGCSLETHLKNVRNYESTPYSYRKISKSGKTTNDKYSISKAISEEPWDYICYQQVSSLSGVFSTFEASLPMLKTIVNASAKVKNPHVMTMLHQTWAYAQNSTHSGFANYNKDQMQMYEAIVDAYIQAQELIDANIVIPAGTAIQNARTSFLGDKLTRDGYHLEVTYGRFIAACTWYEAIFKESVLENTYVPENMSSYGSEYLSVSRNAAHYAGLDGKHVTDMSDETYN